MHYRYTIIQALEAALEATPELEGKVTRSDAFPAEGVAVRVFAVSEVLEQDERSMTPTEENRTLVIRVRLLLSGHDVQADANQYQEIIEGVTPAALEAVADCGYLDRVDFEVEAEQDRETMTASSDYIAEYSTVMGDPSTRA